MDYISLEWLSKKNRRKWSEGKEQWIEKKSWLGALLLTPEGEEFACEISGEYSHYQLGYGELLFEFLSCAKNKNYDSSFIYKGYNNDYFEYSWLSERLVQELLEGLTKANNKNDIWDKQFTLMNAIRSKSGIIHQDTVINSGIGLSIENISINKPIFFPDGSSSYIVTSGSIHSLVIYEIMELFRLKKEFWKCDCGLWYVRKPKQHKNHCPNCPPPSLSLEKNRERVRKCRKLKEERK